jgi:hypothetical protein
LLQKFARKIKMVEISCDHCGKLGIKEQNLKQHMWEHEKERLENIQCVNLVEYYKDVFKWIVVNLIEKSRRSDFERKL